MHGILLSAELVFSHTGLSFPLPAVRVIVGHYLRVVFLWIGFLQFQQLRHVLERVDHERLHLVVGDPAQRARIAEGATESLIAGHCVIAAATGQHCADVGHVRFCHFRSDIDTRHVLGLVKPSLKRHYQSQILPHG